MTPAFPPASRPPSPTPATATTPALLVILAGVCAALHVGKLAPALPALQQALGLTLVQAGFALSLVQLAGVTLALAFGGLADTLGARRSMVSGLVLLGLASAAGGLAQGAAALLAWRALEGLGFLMVVLPAPGLVRRLVPPQRLPAMLGVWGGYMPVGTALALLVGPLAIAAAGWRPWWEWLAGLSLAMALALWRGVPADASSRGRGQAHAAGAGADARGAPALDAGAEAAGTSSHGAPADADIDGRACAAAVPSNHPGAAGNSGLGHGAPAQPGSNRRGSTASVEGWGHRVRQTLGVPGPWLVALCFAVYSSQWLAVVGFLPSIYAAAGLAPAAAAPLTALAAVVNLLGNLAAGQLGQRGVAPTRVLTAGYLAMALSTLAAFGSLGGTGLPAPLRYLAVVVFSGVGGLVPATLFGLAVRVAPSEQTIATTVGWMQQWSALGQMLGPPAVAWLAGTAGGWQLTWLATGACSLAGLGLSAVLARRLRTRP